MHELHGADVPAFDYRHFDFDLTLIPFGRLSLTHAHADFHVAA